MTRGAGERSRQVPHGIIVPLNIFPAVSNRIQPNQFSVDHSQTRGAGQRDSLLDASSMIAIYASQSSEATVERLLPNVGEDRKPHGLLTYTLVQVLTQSNQPLTCRELVQQIQTQYAGWGRSAPTPMIEGKDRDREVFGLTVWPDRSRILLSKNARGWSINAGQLQGITPGSLLSVYADRDRQATSPVAYVRAQIVRTMDAEVVSCDETGKSVSTTPPERGQCELTFVDAGELRLRVALTSVPSADPEQVNRILAMLQPDSLVRQKVQLVKFVESAVDADWLVRVSQRDLTLIPAEFGVSEENPPQGFLNSIGPEPLDQVTDQWLGLALQRIAQAANLRKIAVAESSVAKSGDSVRIDLTVEKGESSQPLDALKRDILKDGETITIRVGNPCQFPMDVTLLFIDSQCGINALFPHQGEINRLRPGDSFSISTRVSSDTGGVEHLIAIAVKSQREVVDFTCLAQSSVDRTETRGSGEKATLNSPLGQLLDHAVFSGSPTRGLKQTSVKSHWMKLVSWETQPKR